MFSKLLIINLEQENKKYKSLIYPWRNKSNKLKLKLFKILKLISKRNAQDQ